MVETFFPRILRFDPPTVIRDESDFMEKYSYIIHGLNFYLFVLMRDVQNLVSYEPYFLCVMTLLDMLFILVFTDWCLG